VVSWQGWFPFHRVPSTFSYLQQPEARLPSKLPSFAPWAKFRSDHSFMRGHSSAYTNTRLPAREELLCFHGKSNKHSVSAQERVRPRDGHLPLYPVSQPYSLHAMALLLPANLDRWVNDRMVQKPHALAATDP